MSRGYWTDEQLDDLQVASLCLELDAARYISAPGAALLGICCNVGSDERRTSLWRINANTMTEHFRSCALTNRDPMVMASVEVDALLTKLGIHKFVAHTDALEDCDRAIGPGEVAFALSDNTLRVATRTCERPAVAFHDQEDAMTCAAHLVFWLVEWVVVGKDATI